MRNKWVACPYYVWMVIFIVVPLLLVVYYSITKNVNGEIIFTLENFQRVFTPIHISVMRKSLAIAFYSTVICFILGYPVAYILSTIKSKKKNLILFLFILPMWMNFLLRTYSWVSILERNGLLNAILSALRLPEINILYTDYAVLLGMVYAYLPFMILPIYTVLNKMDKSLIEAAQDLGANQVNVFCKVILPLSIPGVMSGITMVFMPSVTTFVISNLLGGGQYILIGNLIERQFINVGDQNLGSALSVILMIIILITMGIFSIIDKNPTERKGAFL